MERTELIGPKRAARVKLALLWFSLGFLPLFVRPLWEPDEARYAEVAREMIASHDWLTPRLNGVLYFEKPPLQYWLSAVSMKVFGLHVWAARVPLALAWAMTLACAFQLARRLGARQPLWAPLMVATALLSFVVGQILTLDALFSALCAVSLTAVVEAVFARVENRGALGWTVLAFTALSGAVLTKGLVAIVLLGASSIFSLVVLRKEAFRATRLALLRVLFHPLGWSIFAALTVPWFVMVDNVNPDHARFFFVHEHWDRFTTHEHGRQGSHNALLDKFYFVGVLIPGLLPWLSFAWIGLRTSIGKTWRTWRGSGEMSGALSAQQQWLTALLVSSCVWTLLFFSFSGSKLPTYILPLIVPLAALAASFERRGDELRALRRMGVELIVLSVVVVVGGLVARDELVSSAQSFGLLPLLALVLLSMGCWAIHPKHLTSSRWAAALIGLMLLITLTSHYCGSANKDVVHLVRRAPENTQWISYASYHQGIAWGAQTRVVAVACTGELEFGKDHLTDAEQKRWFTADRIGLAETAERMQTEDPSRPVWMIAKARAFDDLPPARQNLWHVVERTANAVLARWVPVGEGGIEARPFER